MNYAQPSVELWNIRIDEPVTTLTDLILAGICFYAYFGIKRVKSTGRSTWYFKYYFLLLGLGAGIGGIFGHAFLYLFPPNWKLVSWIFTLIAVAFLVQAVLELARSLVKPWLTSVFAGLNLLALVIALFVTLWKQEFSPVKYYSIFGMVAIVGSLSIYIFRKTGESGVLKLPAAVGLGLVSALVFSYGWGVGPYFNHKDICHVILSLSVLIFYKGAIQILNSRTL
jgi:hypothetical protein